MNNQIPYCQITITASTGMCFTAGDFIQLTYDVNNFILAQVDSYDPISGILIFTPYYYEGSGTYCNWKITLSGLAGTSGSSGSSGTSGSSGSSGTSGSSGSSGTSGSSGSSGTSGSSGSSGTDGSSGSSGSSGTSGSSGSSGTSGSSGSSGTSGSSGSSGTSGSSGSSGTSGSSGSSGTGFNTVENPALTRILTSDGTPNGAIAQSGLTYNFGTRTLSISGKAQFDTATTATTSVGGVVWDDGAGTLAFGLKGGNVQTDIGLQNSALCFNDDTVTLTKGMVVYVSGSQGNRPRIKRGVATSDAYSVTILGVVAETIAVGAEGFVTTFGMVNNLNTIGLSGGTPLWLSPTVLGGYTETKPIAPQHTVLVGYVVRVHASVGSIFVHTSNGWELEELHNVRISGVTDGDLLVYDSDTNLWVNSKIIPSGLTVSGDVVTYGNQYVHSASGASITTGTTILTSISCTSGSSAQFDYFVQGISNEIRSGIVMAAWNCTGATYTDYSTTDLNGSTEGIAFQVDTNSNNIRLKAVVTQGTWIVKVGTRIIF